MLLTFNIHRKPSRVIVWVVAPNSIGFQLLQAPPPAINDNDPWLLCVYLYLASDKFHTTLCTYVYGLSCISSTHYRFTLKMMRTMEEMFSYYCACITLSHPQVAASTVFCLLLYQRIRAFWR
jgi:hypothetical protein